MLASRSRRFRAALGSVTALALAACNNPPAPVSPSTAALTQGAEARPSRGELEPQLAALRRATVRFHHFDVAQRAGYTAQVTECMTDPHLGGMGFHYGSPTLIEDGTVALLTPEVLLYEPQRDGSIRLVGVEYIVPFTAWHGEAPPTLFGQDFRRNEVFGVWALHVWVWEQNPSGVFADWNPRVGCPQAP